MQPRPSAHQHARAWLGALLLLAACASSEPEPVPFEPLNVPAAPNFASGDYVFTTAAAWSTAWLAAPQQFHADPFNLQHVPLPAVDFSVHTVVGVSLGVGTRCFVPRITAVLRDGDTLEVQYRSNADTGVVTLACAHPWSLAVFAKVPALGGDLRSVRFVRRVDTEA